MTISDLNPIQFWPVNQIGGGLPVFPTFNEKIEPGIDRGLDFIYTPYINDLQLLQVRNVLQPWLVIYDSNDVSFGALPFVETSVGSGIWNLIFLSASFVGDTSCVRFKLCTVFSSVDIFHNPSFLVHLSPWADDGGAAAAWAWVAPDTAKVRMNVVGVPTNKMTQNLAQTAAGVYYMALTSKDSAPGKFTEINIGLYFDNTLVTLTTLVGESSGAYATQIVAVVAASKFNNVKVWTQLNGGADDYYYIIDGLYLNTFHAYFRSDLISFSDSVFGTQLLQYSNVNDYAGISYAAAEKFCLRVPAKFYEEREPEEDESEALSDSTVVKLAGTVKRQRFLEIEPLPPYLIFKIKLILKHNTLKIGDFYYIQEESMDVSKLNDRFALFLSKVWLTLRDDGYFTNVYGASVTLDPTNNLPDPETDFTSDVTYIGEVEAASDETYIGEPDALSGETYIGNSLLDWNDMTYFGSPEPAHGGTYLGGLIDEGGETYLGAPKAANDETYLGGAIDEGGETYIGAAPSANAELVFADEVEGSILTYIGDDMNEHPGWGCILGRCSTNIGSSVIAWNGGDSLHWDDDDEIKFGG